MHWLRAFYLTINFLALSVIAPSLVTSAASASPISYIRDTEIENAIRFYCLPIFNVAGLDANSVQIHLVNDSRLNAFVADGQQIFINSGTLMKAEIPEEVIGVLAHETGHIVGGHLSQLYKNIEFANTVNAASAILGLPLAILAGRPEIALAALGLGAQVSTRNLLKYTRQNEEAADQAAIRYLDASGISSRGMVKFLEKVLENTKLYSVDQNPYTQTHPLAQSRIDFINNHIAISSHSDKSLPDSYYVVHDRIRAKLFGYIESFERVMLQYPESDTSVPAHYARAIAHKEHGNFDKALEITEKLLKMVPEDPFFLELKGDIYLDAAKLEEAIAAYDQAIEILPWAALIHHLAGRARIETNDAELLPLALENLQAAVRLEPDNASNWRLLAIVHGKLGDRPNTALALAEEALLRNNLDTARIQAKRARDLQPIGSPGQLRAEDIINKAEELKRRL